MISVFPWRKPPQPEPPGPAGYAVAATDRWGHTTLTHTTLMTAADAAWEAAQWRRRDPGPGWRYHVVELRTPGQEVTMPGP